MHELWRAAARMKYRPDIEGLRALAILLVLAAHAKVPGFDGGYIGVDIFFVISGYLMTGLLVTEHGDSGRIDFARFYARRFRRLLPALLLMLAASSIAVWVLLSPASQMDQARAGASSSLWVSNLYFAFQQIDYFGATAETNIYLHTWSLGVEEQFYLVWPLLIVMFLRGQKGSVARNRTVCGMAVVLMTSLLVCLWLTHISTRYAFYLMPARAWQFAAGAIVYLQGPRLVGFVDDLAGKSLANAIGAAGILLLIAAVLAIDSNTPYPGVWALLPTIATSLLLLPVGSMRSLTTRALSAWPMQMIGRVSYSWYLWHWPVLILGAIFAPVQALGFRLLLVLLSLLLAVLSLWLVERPFRRNAEIIRVPRQFILASLMVMGAATLLLTRWSDSVQTLASAEAHGASKAFRAEMPIIYPMGCDDWYFTDRLAPCVFGPGIAPKTAIVIGDSIGLQWFPAFEKVFSGPDWRLVVLTKSSCPMVERPFYYPRLGRTYTECDTWRKSVLEYVASLEPEIVVLGSSHVYDFSDTDWVEGTRTVLSKIAPVASGVFILRSTPLLPFDAATCVRSQLRLLGEVGENACQALDDEKKNQQVASWLTAAASHWSNVEFLDMNDLVCKGGLCRATRGDELIYRDAQHLNAEFAAGLAGAMAERMDLGPTSPKHWMH